MGFYRALRPILFSLPTETAHHLALWALKRRILPSAALPAYSSLSQKLWGLEFCNPVGLAAGFDKDGEALPGLFAQGFGFVEAGTVTLKPQPGNPLPRLFRLQEDEAIINRMGFNGKGAEKMQANLQALASRRGVLGINIGRNKETEDPIRDYTELLARFAKVADYIAVNISSPNTPGLRGLQEDKHFESLLAALKEKKSELNAKTPILIKLAPDLDKQALQSIGVLAVKYGVDGLIVSNTTIARNESLQSAYKNESGGLSGKPLFESSTEALRTLYRQTEGTIPLIGVGGIFSAQDAYAKIKAGASLVQVYSGLIYEGFGLVRNIVKGLAAALERDGFKRISEAVGTQLSD